MLPVLAAFSAAQLASAAKSAITGGSSSSARATHTPSLIPDGSPEPAASNPAVWVNPYANARALTEEERAIITATEPVLAQVGLELTTRFYRRMLGNHKHLNHIFNQAHQDTGMQPKALAAAVHAYAANINDLTPLLPAVARMAHKHCSLSVVPQQYTIVGENLLATLDKLLTEAGYERAKIDAILAAWGVAYGQLANLLILEEEKLYKAAESAPGGWRGWREFIVEKRVNENEAGDIVSFYFRPLDGGRVPTHHPGQYTTVRVQVPGNKAGGDWYWQPRQYTLSQTSDDRTFRISVKREDALDTAAAPHPVAAGAAAGQCPFMKGSPAGVVSNVLHSTLKEGSIVQLAPPFGDFVLHEDQQTPVVLLAAGVGITPCVSMAETALKAGRAVSFLYGAHSGSRHPMRDWLTSMRTSHSGKFRSRVWYSRPESADVKGKHYDVQGRMALADDPELRGLVHADAGAHYYICGPASFMREEQAALAKLGISADRIHAEVFNTGHVEFEKSS